MAVSTKFAYLRGLRAGQNNRPPKAPFWMSKKMKRAWQAGWDRA